jgi:outer membrane lipoprotein LolB
VIKPVRCGIAAACAFLVLFFTGCSLAPIQPVENPELAWQERETRLRQIAAWDIQGRLLLRSGKEGGQMSLHWRREGENDVIDLSGPLGKRLLRLSQNPSGAELRDAEQKIFRAENAQALLLDTTGWDVPLAGLHYWILGIPLPGVPERHTLDERGRLKNLSQSGWDIRFLDYARYNGEELPSRLFLRLLPEAVTPGGSMSADPMRQTPVLELRLVVEHWTLRTP